MFDLLPESNRPRGRAAGPKLAAATLHLGLLAGVVFGRAPAEQAPAVVIDSIVFFDPPAIPHSHASQTLAVLHGPPELPPIPEQVTPALPVPVLVGSSHVPDPGTVLAPLASAHGLWLNPGSDSSSRGGEVLLAAEVDEPVVILEQVPPVYPRVLSAAGISGRVVLEFVVDTAGRVERESLHVVSSTEPAFEVAARAAMLATRFRPARVKGQPVRQLARQAMGFSAR